jgi:D-alanyl-D-alanine carboxypeptidase/Putative Flp pilus-assembly TadE/G-like
VVALASRERGEVPVERWVFLGRRGGGGDGGQVVPLAVAMVGLLVVALLALVPAAAALSQRTQAGTAADAAALAGAAEGEEAARRLAEANGAEVVTYEQVGGEVEVRVRVGDVEATARAAGHHRRVGPPGGGGAAGSGERAGLSPALVAALARADALLGYPVPVVSGLRTYEEQQALWERRATNPYPVARPGTSDHERGAAVDVARSAVPAVVAVAAAAGLCQPLPATDPVHFVACGG